MKEILHILTGNWYGVIITLISVMFLLNYATGILEEQLSVLGKKLKIAPSVRGATFDAISSSLPEFLTALIGLMILGEKGLEVGIGTISGSAIFNILVIPFFALLFYKGKDLIKVEKSGINRDSIFYILSILIFLAGLFFGQLFIMGIILVILYILYIIVLYIQSKKNMEINEKEITKNFLEVKDKKVCYIKIIFSLVLIYLGVELSVHSAQFIGESLGISTMVISLVLLAAITSIPDTLLSVKSSQKGDIDAGLSNAVGSNIFDICIGLGVPILIGIGIMGLDPKVEFNSQIPVFGFLIFSVITYLIVLSSKKLNKKSGIVLIGLYILFIIYLIFISL